MGNSTCGGHEDNVNIESGSTGKTSSKRERKQKKKKKKKEPYDAANDVDTDYEDQLSIHVVNADWVDHATHLKQVQVHLKAGQVQYEATVKMAGQADDQVMLNSLTDAKLKLLAVATMIKHTQARHGMITLCPCSRRAQGCFNAISRLFLSGTRLLIPWRFGNLIYVLSVMMSRLFL